jgi:cbb3-type cytochrome oxidase maturation protein
VDVLLLLVFLSAVLALLGVGLFVWSVRERTFDQADRLALLPLRDDAGPARPRVPHAPLASSARPSAGAPTDPSESTGNPATEALARCMK